MPLPITKKILLDWAGTQVVREAESMVERGVVVEAECVPPQIIGAVVWNGHPLKTGLHMLKDGTVENKCPCRASVERGIVCAHAIAVALALIKRATDPEREAKYQAELRRASRIAEVREEEYIRRCKPGEQGSIPARITVGLGKTWVDGFSNDAVPLACRLESGDNSWLLDEAPRRQLFALNKKDESLLYVLDDISEGPARGNLTVKRRDFLNILSLGSPDTFRVDDGQLLRFSEETAQTQLRVRFDPDTGRLRLALELLVKDGSLPAGTTYVLEGRAGWALWQGTLYKLDILLPEPYHALYGPGVDVQRSDMVRFLRHELPLLEKFVRVESDVTEDLFTIEPAQPAFKLVLRGSPAALAAELHAIYGGVDLIACRPDALENFGIPDADDLMRYTVRNPNAEQAAVAHMNAAGFIGHVGDKLENIVGSRDVLRFLGAYLPSLRRRGWRLEMEGRIAPFFEGLEFATPVVKISESGGGSNWFDVSFGFEDSQGASLSHADIQRAMAVGDSFLQQGARTILIDAAAIEEMTDVFSDCSTEESDRAGHFRMTGAYAPFVKSCLDGLDGVDVEDAPGWRARCDRQNRLAPMESVPLPSELDSILRPYQKEGVAWLRFLEKNRFCGLLADEMGLGKTVQTLAWLLLERANPQAAGKPALIVCPTSIVHNWAEEAARYAPSLKVVVLSGADRHERWELVKNADLLVTSYAILRRDLDKCLEFEFSTVVLDEAQHIKNKSTQNALATKRLQGFNRLVLTGTPVENSVSDIWSIMDFLMPGYLGKHDSFRTKYELPIQRGGPDAQLAQAKLKRKLHPFIMRRLKTQVARDLPPKIERVASCTLSADQKLVYMEILNKSRKNLSNMVAQNGINRCRMEVLAVLMRLRQVCCHLELLKLPGLTPDSPSAKLDLFWELMDEAIDSGHRVLVFSQFVSMLQILKRELEARQLTYCYLDGSTKDRMQVVHTFNACREIPVFLISLKAGGTGLNLTGADMVIHFDPWWNPAVENQATDRAYRIGQKRTVYSVKLVTTGTVEEKVLALQRRKQDVINATVENDEGVVANLSWNDIEELLTL